MDGANFDAWVAQGRIILPSEVDLDKDYFLLGHFDNRRREFKATDYPLYAIKARALLAQVTGNADRQMTASTTPTSTTDDNYIDLIGMSLSTNELDPISLGATGNYQIQFSCDYSVSDTSSTGEFVVNVNGVDATASTTSVGLSTGIFRTNIIWQATSVPAGTIIKIRFKVTPGNEGSSVDVYNRTLIIDGVNTLIII